MIFGKDYASIYDTLYKDQDFKSEATVVRQLANEILKNRNRAGLLDLGCGTGNHSQYFQKDFNVRGVDLSEEMLVLARQKAPDVKFEQGDARTFDLGGDDFDVVTMMSAVLGYQHTNEEVLGTIQNVRRHLRPGGLFIFDVWHGPAILLERPVPRLRETQHNGAHILRSMTPTLCAEGNIVRCHYKWWVPGENKIETREEWHTQRYFFPLEIRLMLEMSGFKLFRMGKTGHIYRPVEDTDRDIMYVAVASEQRPSLQFVPRHETV